MDILLINHYAGSLRHGMEYRPFYMGREWTRMGHRVTIAAASCSHVRTVPADVDGAASEETIDGVRYLWLKTPEYAETAHAARSICSPSWANCSVTWTGSLQLSRGAVIASSTYPLDILPAAAIGRAAGARLAFEVHDLWPLSPMELGGMSPYHPFIVLMQRAENFAYRHAQKVISMLPEAGPHMCLHGLAPGKFVHVPNGIDIAEWASDKGELPAEHREVLANARRNGGFAIVYAGAHGVANALDSIVRAAGVMRETAATFVLVGQQVQKSRRCETWPPA